MLGQYHNQNKLIISSTTENRLDYERQEKVLLENLEGLNKRDVTIFTLFGSGGRISDGTTISPEETAALQEELGTSNYDFVVMVQDKDGTELHRQFEHISGEKLIDLLDGKDIASQEARAVDTLDDINR